MKIALWVSGTLNGQALLNWAAEQDHAVACMISMEQKAGITVPWATANIDALKKVSDLNKVDLIFKSAKKTGEVNLIAIDALLKFAKTKYGSEAVAVAPEPEVAHTLRNAARKLKLKTVLVGKK